MTFFVHRRLLHDRREIKFLWGTCSTCWRKHGVNTELQLLLLLAKKLASMMFICAGDLRVNQILLLQF